MIKYCRFHLNQNVTIESSDKCSLSVKLQSVHTLRFRLFSLTSRSKTIKRQRKQAGNRFSNRTVEKISPDALALHVLPFGNNLLEGLEMVLTYLVHSNHQCVYPGKHPQEHQVELK